MAQELSEPFVPPFSRMVLDLQAQDDVTAVLEGVVAAAVREVPGAELAGITIMNPDGAHTPAATDPLVTEIDKIQYAVGAGPCIDAAEHLPIVRSDDLAAEARWPGFAGPAAEHGVRSMLSVQLFVSSGILGALNTYARPAGAFDTESEHIAAALAVHAAVAVAASRTEANLRIALHSRDLIGQAKGILMERHRITAQQAFTMLLSLSQNHNVKLRDLADELTRTGTLPPTRTAGDGTARRRSG